MSSPEDKLLMDRHYLTNPWLILVVTQFLRVACMWQFLSQHRSNRSYEAKAAETTAASVSILQETHHCLHPTSESRRVLPSASQHPSSLLQSHTFPFIFHGQT